MNEESSGPIELAPPLTEDTVRGLRAGSIVRVNGTIYTARDAAHKRLVDAFNSAREVISWRDLLFLDEPYHKWVVYFLVLIGQCDRRISQDVCTRFELTPQLFRIVCEERFVAARRLYKLERYLPKTNSSLYRNLQGFRTEVLLYMMAVARKESVKKAISRFYTRLRMVGG